MKKAIFTLFAAAAIFTSCTQSTNTSNSTADTATIVSIDSTIAVKDSAAAPVLDSVIKK